MLSHCRLRGPCLDSDFTQARRTARGLVSGLFGLDWNLARLLVLVLGCLWEKTAKDWGLEYSLSAHGIFRPGENLYESWFPSTCVVLTPNRINRAHELPVLYDYTSVLEGSQRA